nr:MAG TPA: hypothetical protein [Caudoviricetes sp.]
MVFQYGFKDMFSPHQVTLVTSVVASKRIILLLNSSLVIFLVLFLSLTQL